MPLMDEEPPQPLPRGQYSLRPFMCACGSLQKPQLWSFASLMRLPTPAGMRTISDVSFLPASIRQTRIDGSADSRFASTQPALPAPMIT